MLTINLEEFCKDSTGKFDSYIYFVGSIHEKCFDEFSRLCLDKFFEYLNLLAIKRADIPYYTIRCKAVGDESTAYTVDFYRTRLCGVLDYFSWKYEQHNKKTA